MNNEGLPVSCEEAADNAGHGEPFRRFVATLGMCTNGIEAGTSKEGNLQAKARLTILPDLMRAMRTFWKGPGMHRMVLCCG